VEEKQVILALKANAKQGLVDARAKLEEKKALDASTNNMHKYVRVKAKKDMDKFKEEKKKLEYMIADLLRTKEGTRAKIKKITKICEEF
jgi:hypothetical protein